MLATFLAGGTLIVADNRFDARKALEMIERHRITHTALVPVQFQRLMECEDQDSFDLSSLECAITVGSPMHVDLKRTVHARLHAALYELYGLTEGLITVMEPRDMPEHWNSVGRPILGTDMEILGDNDQILPRGESGEIVGAAQPLEEVHQQFVVHQQLLFLIRPGHVCVPNAVDVRVAGEAVLFPAGRAVVLADELAIALPHRRHQFIAAGEARLARQAPRAGL